MKKYSILFMAALTLMCVGCNEDEGSSEGGGGVIDKSTLIGNWSIQMADFEPQISINANGTFVSDDGWLKIEGNYSLNEDVLAFTPLRKFEYNDSSKVFDEKIIPDSLRIASYCKAKTLYNSSVLVLRYDLENMEFTQGGIGEMELFFKNGVAGVSNVSDIQGTWNWYFQDIDSLVRVQVTFEGDKFDLKVPVWNSRCTGSYVYKDGYIDITIDMQYIKNDNLEDPNNVDEGWIVDDGDYKVFQNGRLMSFVADGNEAYGYFANLPGVFHKK